MHSLRGAAQALPVFLINLDRRPDRLEFMRSQFAAAGMSFTHLPASDGRDPEVLKQARRSRFCQLNQGEIGCFESHIRAWDMLLSSGATAAIVLEDDVILASDFLAVAEGAARLLEFDVIKLDYFSSRVRVEDREHPLGGGRSAFRYLGGDWCAGAYVISRSGAAKLLRDVSGYILPVDHYMYDTTSRIVYSSRIYSVVPAVAVQTASDVVDVAAFASNIKDGTGRARSVWKARAGQAVTWMRLRGGPVHRFLCARRLARITRQHGLRHVENTFVRDVRV